MPKKTQRKIEVAAFANLFAPQAGSSPHRSAIAPGPGYPHQRINSYEEAAKRLFLILDNEHQGELAFPFVFLARHALELKLKEIVRVALDVGFVQNSDYAGKLMQKRLARLWNTHNLKNLASLADPILAKTICAAEWDAQIRPFLLELERADPDGMAFRFDRATNGNPMNYPPKPVSADTFKKRWFDAVGCIEGALATVEAWPYRASAVAA